MLTQSHFDTGAACLTAAEHRGWQKVRGCVLASQTAEDQRTLFFSTRCSHSGSSTRRSSSLSRDSVARMPTALLSCPKIINGECKVACSG